MKEAADLHDQKRHAEACDAYMRAVRFAEMSWSSNAPEMIWPLVCLARAVGEREAGGHTRIAEVLDLEARAMAIALEHFGKDDVRTSYVLERIGLIFWLLGEHDEARERIEKATAIYERICGEGPSTAHRLTMLGDLLITMNLPAEALPHCERALRIEEALEQDSSRVMFGAFWVGQCLLGVGRREEAIAQFERALAILCAKRPPESTGESALSKELREWIAEARGRP
jgi:tetratricopeptide (TPR) repeat protein